MQQRISQQYVHDSKSVKQYAYIQDKNFPIRQSMQDCHFIVDGFTSDGDGLFGVLDGHGGSDVVQFCAKTYPNLFKRQYAKWKTDVSKYFVDVFKKLDQQLKCVGASQTGCTCCVALIQKNKKKMYVANLGDTRAVLYQDGKAKRVTVDHKVTNLNEQKRVKQQGGVIMKGRVSGQLAITRALGDLQLKTEGVSVIPDVQQVNIKQQTKFMIMASDGLWDVIEDDKAIDLVKDCKSTKEMVKILLDFALTNGTKDNVSILAIKFN